MFIKTMNIIGILLGVIQKVRLGGEVKREKRINFFCKLNIKVQCFLHCYVYNNNTNIYMFIKKTLNEKKNVYAFLIKKHLYMLD